MTEKSIAALEADYAEVKQQWLTKHDELQKHKVHLSEVKNNLGSWRLALLQRMGFKREKRKLLVIQSDSLEKIIDSLTVDLHNLEPIVRQLGMDVRGRIKHAQEQILYQQRVTAVAEYNFDPEKFFKSVLFELLPGSEGLKQSNKIYASADKIIAASGAFSHETDPHSLWHAWRIVSKANQIAPDKYHAAAKKMFMILINSLPAGMQGLMFLYAVKDYDRVDYYLAEAYEIQVKGRPELFTDLLMALADEVNITSNTSAGRVLTRMPGFNHLSKDLKVQLTAHYSYGMRLRYDLSFADMTQKSNSLTALKMYAKKLEHNVIDTIANHRTPVQSKQDFDLLKAAIDKREHEIGSRYNLGMGLGLAWVLGIGAPSTLLRTKLETSNAWIRGFDIEHDIELAGLVLPVDYEFIHDLEELWGLGIESAADAVVDNMQAQNNMLTFIRIASMLLGTVFISLFAAWYISLQLWPLYVASALFVVLAVNYLVAKNNLLAKTFTFLFVHDWFTLGDFQADALGNYVGSADFTIALQLADILEKSYPGLGPRLAAHFQQRAAELQTTIKLAKETANNSAAEIIKDDLDKLLQSWQEIVYAIPKPEQFRLLVEQYLYDTYTLGLDEYIKVAKDRKDESIKDKEFDLSKDTTTIVFGRKFPEFNVNFAAQYTQRRQEMQDLYDLKKLF